MIEDIRSSLENGSTADFDLVIIGAGPAGITLAREMAGRGQKIALLEAGGMEPPGPQARALYDGDVTGLSYPLAASRQRFFGGTSNHWGGWCRPLDESDFQSRDWMPLTGWPLDRNALEDHYRRAHDILEIGSPDYDTSRHAERTATLPTDPTSGFCNTSFRFSPPLRFRSAFGDELDASQDIHVLLHASVVDIEHEAGKVRQVRTRTLDGHEARIRAPRFVLATGGLEVPRLLLHTARGDTPALGNRSGFVGRCFMEHFGYTPGHILTRAGLKYHRHEGLDGHSIMPVLAPRPALMREHRLNNCCLVFHAIEPDAGWPPGALLTPGLARRLGDSAWRYRVTMINEPTPNPNSRVTLSDQRDALGMCRLVLDWRIMDRDLESIERAVRQLIRWLGQSGLGRVQFSRPISPETTERFTGGMHHMGTARMSADPEHGVVDADCRVHGSDNLYVASSAVFSAAGYSNPTLSIVALSLRLADHLKGQMA
ncbi:MAG: GMC family oxidoreductase [Wenzhouxiangellaceae bacterium]|nr:GMC family oxidoreductase [Wenzhouxiangellaceae bacterium]